MAFGIGKIGDIAKKLATTAGDAVKKTSPAYQVYKRRKKIVKGAKSAAKKVVTGKAGRYVAKKLYGVKIKKSDYKSKRQAIAQRRLKEMKKMKMGRRPKARKIPNMRKMTAKEWAAYKHKKEQGAYKK